MSTEATSLWPVLSRLQERARRLEEEATALRADVEQVTQALDRPVATYIVNGEKIAITEGDVATVRERLTQPRSDEVVKALALADKIGERRRDLPHEEQERLFWKNVEVIRSQAIADGTAIDDPLEVVGD
jgi:alkylation response protein AidB-like acyl-CoA dehydrogenase